MHEPLRRSEVDLQWLFRFSQELNSTLDTGLLLDSLILGALELVGAESGCAGLYTPAGMVCHKYFRKGIALPLEYYWPPNHGLPGWLIEHKLPYLTNHALADKQIIHELCERFGVWSALSTPILTSSGDVLGFFEVHNKKDGADFTAIDRDKLVAVSHTASVAIQNATAYQKIKHTEEALRKREQQFRAVFEQTSIGIAQTDLTGHFVLVNDRYCKIVQRSREELMGLRMQDVTHPEDRSGNAEQFAMLVEGRSPDFIVEKRYLRPDGSHVWVQNLVSAIHDEHGNRRFVAAAVTDISERKRFEEERERHQEELSRTNSDLRRANADLEQFAYSASHDLQEPIRNISIYGELLKRRYGQALDDKGMEYLSFIATGARRMEMLVNDLLVYAHSATLENTPAGEADATLALESALSNLSAAIEESNAEVIYDKLPEVRVHDVQLEHLFQNLIGNAIKYRTDDERPRIKVTAQRDGSDWLFSVRDNGIGIPAEYKHQVFGIFKRLHGAGTYSGTGIGLAICQKIVERNRGRIWVESEGAGRGSTFCFTLPAKEAPHVLAATPEQNPTKQNPDH